MIQCIDNVSVKELSCIPVSTSLSRQSEVLEVGLDLVFSTHHEKEDGGVHLKRKQNKEKSLCKERNDFSFYLHSSGSLNSRHLSLGT